MSPFRITAGVVASGLVLLVAGDYDQAHSTATSPDPMVLEAEPLTLCRPSAFVEEDSSITVTLEDCTMVGISNEDVRWSEGFSGPYSD